MANPILFDKKATDKIESEYSRVKLNPEAQKNIDGLAKIYTKFVPLSEVVMKGFMLLTVKDFQEKTHLTVKDLQNPNLPRRKEHFDTMTQILLEKLSRTLLKPEYKAQLLTAIQEANKLLARV